MPSYSDIRHSPYRPEQLYALVMDVERYPEFLPWCRAARITERKADYFIGELMISFSHLTERYSSKVVGVPPREEIPSPSAGEGIGRGAIHDAVTYDGIPPHPTSPAGGEASIGRIDVTLVQGPFKHLSNHWQFVPNPAGGTDIHFSVDFQFKYALLERLIGGMFTRAVEKMSAAFLARADALYKSAA